MTMTYKFLLLDLCGKAPFTSLKLFLLMLNGTIDGHNSYTFIVYMYG